MAQLTFLLNSRIVPLKQWQDTFAYYGITSNASALWQFRREVGPPALFQRPLVPACYLISLIDWRRSDVRSL